jgi:hypothetical protein
MKEDEVGETRRKRDAYEILTARDHLDLGMDGRMIFR